MRKRKIKFVIIIFVTFFVVMIVLKKINEIVNPVLLVYAKEGAYNFTTKIINSSVNASIENVKNDDLFIICYGANKEIMSIDFDSIVINKLISKMSLNIEKEINSINDKIYDIPLGILFKSSFLTNCGPKIPVKIKLVGSILNNIDTKITNYGINNGLIEVYVNIKVNIKVVLPFISEDILVESSIPIAIKLINGRVPEYYMGTTSTNPLLSIPIE